MSEWISVKDRLPEFVNHVVHRNRYGKLEFEFETSKWVLTYHPNGLDGDSSIQSTRHIQRRISYVKSEGNWIHSGATHWQPLPDPPKESTDAD